MEHKQNAGVFRKSYGEIGTIRSCLGPDVPCLALTATATRQTRLDICNSLGKLRLVASLIRPRSQFIHLHIDLFVFSLGYIQCK